MPPPDQVPLYVRLAAEPSRRLDMASAISGKSKRQIVEEAVCEHLGDDHIVLGRIQLRETAPEEVLTLDEAAAMLRVSSPDLAALADARGIPGRRIAGEWRFARAALLAWLAGSDPPPPPPAHSPESAG